MIIKIIILVFVLFVSWRTYLRFKKNDISFREFLIWLILWLFVILASFLPQKTDIIAQWLGVSRGADLLVYLSIMVIFFIVFKLIVKQERLDREITFLIRQNAIEDKLNNKKND